PTSSVRLNVAVRPAPNGMSETTEGRKPAFGTQFISAGRERRKVVDAGMVGGGFRNDIGGDVSNGNVRIHDNASGRVVNGTGDRGAFTLAIRDTAEQDRRCK